MNEWINKSIKFVAHQRLQDIDLNIKDIQRLMLNQNRSAQNRQNFPVYLIFTHNLKSLALYLSHIKLYNFL